MRLLTGLLLFTLTLFFSCKSSKEVSSKNEQTTSENKKETPYEIKQTEKVPNQSIGAPTPSGGTNGARPEPQ